MTRDLQTNKLENILSKLNNFLIEDQWDEIKFGHTLKKNKETLQS